MPTIEENGGGVMAIVQRKTIDEVIAERGGDVGVNSREISDVKLTERQTIMVSVIKSNPMVTAKQMSETLSVTVRTIERDLALMQKAGIIRHEGSDKTGVWVILEQGNTNS
ncbi:HTH domain-containing protein [Prevotella copri]|uniref:HTH domain-containing protein n=1 Tax=Segatella copri TaxID=165179 RepID=UPI001C384E07|nr:HTH domain-containing protein [Segatella copri]MBV3401985.1 HTH domain-containing protein [Segatella copri]